MKKKRDNGQIEKNDYVELIGTLPERLQKIRKPIYGTVIAIKGDIATVKPRYRHFEIEVNIKDLKDVAYEKFHRKQRKKAICYKGDCKTKVTVIGEGPVRVIPKPDAIHSFSEIVEDKIEKAEAAINTEKPAPIIPQQEKPATPFITSPVESLIPKPAVIPLDVSCDTKKELYKNDSEHIKELAKDGNTVIYVVLGIFLLAAAVCSYFLLFN